MEGNDRLKELILHAQTLIEPTADDCRTQVEVRESYEKSLEAINNWVRTVVVLVEGHTISIDTVREVCYNEDDISSSLQEQAGKVAWWGGLSAKLAKIVAVKKAQLERTRAAVDTEVRNGTIAVAGGKITEKAVESAVILDARVQKLEDELLEAQAKQDEVKAVLEALRHRKEALYIDGMIQLQEWKSTGSKIKS